MNDPLMVAARFNDADTEERGLRATVERLGLDLDELLYVAEQRAARVVLIRRGRLHEISRTQMVPLRFNANERAEIDGLIPLYLDAICIGWRAQDLKRRDNDGASPPERNAGTESPG